MLGRIELYIHSDSTTENKGGVLIKVTCDTDFAARTAIFKAFAHRAAMHAFGAIKCSRFIGGGDVWQQIIAMFPHMEDERLHAQRELKEQIGVTEVVLLKL